jgi:hypothetical protein
MSKKNLFEKLQKFALSEAESSQLIGGGNIYCYQDGNWSACGTPSVGLHGCSAYCVQGAASWCGGCAEFP